MKFTSKERQIIYRALGDLLDFWQTVLPTLNNEAGVAAGVEEIQLIESLLERI